MRVIVRSIAIVIGVVLAVNVASAQPVRIGIPERNNLQYMSFWVAQGAGLFKAEGLDVQIVIPDAANQSGMILMQNRVDVSLLQPPVYLGLIAEQHPFALFASLLANDPINLILRADVAKRLEIDRHAPVVDRLKAIKGLRIGVAPEPPRRLRILYSHFGMDADRDVQIVIRRAEDQLEAFTTDAVDALYTHTPFLEDAIARLNAVVVVNQSSGEVPPLASGQVHALGATTAYIAAHPGVITKVTRAIARAQQIIHLDTAATIAALRKAGIESPSTKHLETIVNLYRPAIPQTPRVSAALVEKNSTLYPARPTMPDFRKVKAEDFVDPSFADQPSKNDAPVLRAAGVIPLPNVAGRIDHLAFDPGTQRLFVAALGNDTVEVVDTIKGAHLRTLSGFHEPQGLAVVPAAGGIAVANGDTGTLQLIDSSTLQIRWTTNIGGDADNVRYDAARKRILVAAVGGLFAVDPATGKVTNQIAIDGHPESFQLEQQGARVFANLPGLLSSQIIRSDRASWSVQTKWPSCGGNYPMALDEPGHRLLVGCRRPASLAIVDTESGKIIATTATVGDTDDLFYDADRKRVYVIGGEGAVDVLARDGDTTRRDLRVPTRDGARTGLWVPSLRRLFVAAPARGRAGAELRVFEPID
jgi:ABC-type nitrate/sulfonate/bicarbonate transport system substrate-binding protein